MNLYKHSNYLTIFLLLLASVAHGQRFATQSVLSEGEFYKISVSEAGFHKIDANLLQEVFQQEIASLPADRIALYTGHKGMLPEVAGKERTDDLQEIPLYLSSSQGSLSANDYLLFYAEGPSPWQYNEKDSVLHRPINVYDTKDYYYLHVKNAPALRIDEQDHAQSSTGYISSSGDKAMRYEIDKINVLHPFFASQGSGQSWLGDRFKDGGSKDYSDQFDFQNVSIGNYIKGFVSFAGRSEVIQKYSIQFNQENFPKSIPSTEVGNVESTYVHARSLQFSTTLRDIDVQLILDYPKVSASSDGWLDYIEIHAEQDWKYEDRALWMVDYQSTTAEYTKYVIKNNGTGNPQVWDITVPNEVHQLAYTINPTNLIFHAPSTELRQFMVFEPSTVQQIPHFEGKVNNQNLHAITEADMLIVYHPSLKDAAAKLKAHRESYSELKVVMADVQQIYNEFAGGKQDPIAIRDFVKMLKSRDADLRYLLLFGDASFDYRHIYSDSPDLNLVPTYQTKNSFSPLNAFPSDDFFGLLNDHEGEPALRGALDVAIGRLPIKNSTEGMKVVDKIIYYDQSENTFGDWKLKAGFVADDEDNAQHLDFSDGIAKKFTRENESYNLEKIYFDAFKQEATPGGERYPAVNKAINDLFFKGAFIINYMGHGGPEGWADERVLQLNDIDSWDNKDKLPLLITATCTFTGFDDPSKVSPGELCLLNEKGGAIALMSTVRAVISSSNRRLAQSVFDHITTPVNGAMPTLGEVMRGAKNGSPADTISPLNARKFLLIGDPSMRLSYPDHRISTKSITESGTAVSLDTLRAFQSVTVKGQVEDHTGLVLTDFNGSVFPTLFDKEVTIQTLQQNTGSRKSQFDVQRNIVYKGAVQAVNGEFEFSFVVPKDINYSFGEGKISYYATDGKVDASGHGSIVIGGTKQSAEVDEVGPIVTLYLNDETFVDGSIVEPNALLVAKIADDQGINVTGNSIGHDLTVTIDNNTEQVIVLNEFFKPEFNNSAKGVVEYRLPSLAPGVHTLTVRAWDLSNNSGEASITFRIEDRPESEILLLSNYPNPFSESTQFVFEHGMTDATLDVELRIYDAAGKLVVSINEQVTSNGFKTNPLFWEGIDNSGKPLNNGVYFYHIRARPNVGRFSWVESTGNRLVILR